MVTLPPVTEEGVQCKLPSSDVYGDLVATIDVLKVLGPEGFTT